MPPSPALRFSPVRDLRTENHKRGRSLEGGLHLKDKDDDLALFNDMQTRERETFLLQSSDELDDSLSTKLRYFSDFKLGITIPVRGESSDLLNADGEKNDYDWLLTPPDTPLFPSLDDETPPVNLVQRGRPRSQPISISRTGMTEKSYRTTRSSASPHRLSPSPRSVNNTIQSRGRPSSASHSSPTPVPRSTTPSRRPSTPPNKPSTPTSRSSTPTLRRMSTGSSGQPLSSGRRGTSPGNSSRGNSASPKLQAWQSTLPGFSSDPPPNLRTSLSDRPTSHTRGLSPASRNGRDSSSKFGRLSMSPTARSATSSHSHDRDRFSSQSKGSVASSGDDDMDSLKSVTVGISAARKNGPFPNSRTVGFSKKGSRTLSTSSAPKRSFDSALRQMDHRKSPQNMFRPLLSSVPASTFYVGKASTAHRPLISRNSSVTTSSNASSDHGASVAPETEGSDHDQGDDLNSEWRKTSYPDPQEEVFIFDKVEELHEDIGHEICDGKPSNGNGHFDGSSMSQFEASESEKRDAGDPSEVDHCEMMSHCSKCGRKFYVTEPGDENVDVCEDCTVKDEPLTPGTPETPYVCQSNMGRSDMVLEENILCKELESEPVISGLPEKSSSEAMLDLNKWNVEQGNDCLEEVERRLVDPQFVGHQTVTSSQSGSGIVDQQLQHCSARPSLRVDGSEGAGISVLLKRSSSSKWPVVQGRSFSATNISFDDPSYARDIANSMRSSIGHNSVSASSSVDLSSSRQTESRFHRQVSGRKSDLENSRDGMNAMPPSTRLSSSGISNNAPEALVRTKSTSEENCDDCVRDMELAILEQTQLVTEEKASELENTETTDTDAYFIRAALLEEDKLDQTDSCRLLDASASELSSHTQCIQLEGNSAIEFRNDGDRVSSGNVEDLRKYSRSISDMDVSFMTAESPIMEENAMLNKSVYGDCSDVLTHGSSVMILGELEGDHDSSTFSQTDWPGSPNSKSIIEAFQEPSFSSRLEEDALVAASESDILDHSHEGTAITVERPNGHKLRSLTLDEATDTILFCSSIIHNLAYQAATIAIEKDDSVPLEGSRPTVTLLGKSTSNRKEPRGRSSNKRTPKSVKAKQKRLETNVKTPLAKTDDDMKFQDDSTCNGESPKKVESMKPPKLESKCNCTVM
ncbi:RUN/FYVE domain protein [Tasmannia lanceolata]|uniref:RUN/FYVE domain protein n=1 Tax=Tasmannia lanceolata TaxID=3420 RepID=UPI0040636B01